MVAGGGRLGVCVEGQDKGVETSLDCLEFEKQASFCTSGTPVGGHRTAG